jgi:hypothetical protein
MAFTRNHINAFVIVGGDSDFIALVEKLKQYDKKVLVVGGRAFTSVILQKNCHEFIAYENLIAVPQATPRRHPEKTRTVADGNLAKAFPLVRRALKVLTEREVSPQLGLLKSTLLQLDSTFSERDYGASTFRDFIEKMAAGGFVKLKQVDRSLLVELKDGEAAGEEEEPAAPAVEAPVSVRPAPAEAGPSPTPAGSTPIQIEECVRAMQEVFQSPKVTPHWPMYLRNVKQFIKNAAPLFDERRYGFGSFLEAVRSAQRAGVFRLERNRQGILRVYPGNQIDQTQRAGLPASEESAVAEQPFTMEESAPMAEISSEPEAYPREIAGMEQPIELTPETPQPESQVDFGLDSPPARRRRAAATTGARRKTAQTKATPAKRTRKKTAPAEGEPAP